MPLSTTKPQNQDKNLKKSNKKNIKKCFLKKPKAASLGTKKMTL